MNTNAISTSVVIINHHINSNVIVISNTAVRIIIITITPICYILDYYIFDQCHG
jgi:hypothetical protein